MPSWSDPLEIIKDAGILQKLFLALLGLVTWEIITQLSSDWNVITRKRGAHWPSFFYFYCKYSIWLGTIGVNLIDNVTTELNCQALVTFTQFAIHSAGGAASTLLMLRAIAIWNHSPFVTVPLVVASLGQWGILFHDVITLKASWNYVFEVCEMHSVPPATLESVFLYTMSFDLVILVLTTIRLVTFPDRSPLWEILLRQGVVYFLVAFVANMIPTVFLLLKLNPIMDVMFCVPAVIASSIVACRLFVSLGDFLRQDVPDRSTHLSPVGGSSGGDVIQIRADHGAGASIDSIGGDMTATTALPIIRHGNTLQGGKQVGCLACGRDGTDVVDLEKQSH